ncbi:unnamed protein product [Microthlaspi erraticum]|uniref:Uncharacterized protein n=1 Tax=Microthlaspi erraticum TaxID=1685480 RepID=A0A6D2K307_9BRAS|nr:unnamed protein product [Microthlaspi erraticum]
MSPYSSSIHTHGSRPQNYHPSNPQRNARVEPSGSANQPAQQDVEATPVAEGQTQADSSLSMVRNLLSQVLHGAIPGNGNGVPLPPDFVKIVTTMKTLGTYHFEGEPDLYQADTIVVTLV